MIPECERDRNGWRPLGTVKEMDETGIRFRKKRVTVADDAHITYNYRD